MSITEIATQAGSIFVGVAVLGATIMKYKTVLEFLAKLFKTKNSEEKEVNSHWFECNGEICKACLKSHSRLPQKFLDLDDNLDFSGVLPMKRKSIEIVVQYSTEVYSKKIAGVLNNSLGVKDVSIYCDYNFSSKLVDSVFREVNEQLREELPREYAEKFIDIVNRLSRPFVTNLKGQIEDKINHRRVLGYKDCDLVMDIMWIHYYSLKSYLGYLHVSVILLNGHLDSIEERLTRDKRK
jgi:hypothetical protein